MSTDDEKTFWGEFSAAVDEVMPGFGRFLGNMVPFFIAFVVIAVICFAPVIAHNWREWRVRRRGR